MKKFSIKAISLTLILSAVFSGNIISTVSVRNAEKNGVSLVAYAASDSKNVKGFKLASSTPSSVTLNWNTVKNADGYTVYSYNAKNKKYTKICNTKKTTVTIKKLSAGKTYKYAVKAYVKDGKKLKYGKCSDILSVKTSEIKKISGLKITTGNKSKQLILKWNTQSGVSGYQILRSTTGKSNSYKKIATVSSSKNTYTDSSLKDTTTYYYAVRAYKKNSDGSINYGNKKYIDLSTKASAKSIASKLVKAKNVYDKYIFPLNIDVDKNAEKIDGTLDGIDVTYYRVKGNLKTKKAVEKELSKYFTPKSSIKSIVNHNFIEKNGKLYVYDLWDRVGDFPLATKWTLTPVSVTDKKVKMHFYGIDEYWDYPCDGEIIMNYEEGRWKLDLTNNPFDLIFFEDMNSYVTEM